MFTPAPPAHAALALLPLLVIASCGKGGRVSAAEPPWFVDITAECGLDFVQRSGARGGHELPEIMGGGVALFDAEGDGDLDLYCVDGSGEPAPGEAGAGGASRFYRQEADGRFHEATQAAGLLDRARGMGVAVADVDNDGDEDLLVTHVGSNAFFRNLGEGRFAEEGAAAGCAGQGWSSSAAFFDLDRDGFLELYVARYVEYRDKPCFDNAGRADYCGPKAFPPAHDLLFRNTGGTFLDVSHASGVDVRSAAGLGVVCADFDEDGWPDVYVANDAWANFLWINRHDGTLRDEALQRGAALNLSGQPQAGMGVVAGDFDGDARLDLFVTHLREEANALYLNRGPAGFLDATGTTGMGATSMPFTGFGVAALDLEQDGDLDLVVANGAVFRTPPHAGCELAPPWDEYAQPNLLQRNEGGGRFRDASAFGGALTGRIEISRGLAAGDVDGDGDLDLLLGAVEGPARLFRNDVHLEGRHWVALRCVHPGWRRDALGAQVELVACGQRHVRFLSSSWSYASSSPPVASFGLDRCETIEGLEVLWPDGVRERFPAPALDRSSVLERGTGTEVR